MSVAEYFREREAGFRAYHASGIATPTLNNYVNRLREMDWLYVPEDVIQRGGMNASEKNALNSFLNYFDGVGTKDFNGYEKAQFTKTAAKVQTGKGSRKDQKTTNLGFDELITTRDKLTKPLQVLFMIAAYCGGRLEQINRLYEKVAGGEDLRVDDYGDFFRVDVRHVSAGGKRASYYYFPTEMRAAVLNYRNAHSPDTVSKKVSDAGRDNYREEHGKQVHRPVNVSSLRKFNTLLLRKAGVDKDVTNALQGRAPDGVDEEHYLELADDMGREQYPRVIPLLREGLPVPDWMRNYAGNDPYTPAGGKPFDEKRLKKMLLDGATNAEIKKAMGLHPDRITAFVKANGIKRTRGVKKTK